MTNTNTINTRIQLKSDTQAKWELIDSTFIPLNGEIIIYAPDDTHEYSRLKVGDGSTVLARLKFIDAGSIEGTTLQTLTDLQFNITRTPVTVITQWRAGSTPTFEIVDSCLNITRGEAPTLISYEQSVISNIEGDGINNG